MKLLILKLKRNILPLLFLLFAICLILFSKSNIEATQKALQVWVHNVIPSLFPFFIATELLHYTSIPQQLGNLLHNIMRPVFNVPGIGAYALLMGVLSGYPVGAKIVTNFRSQHLCTKEEAERLITFTNNSGPLFIIGTVGTSLFYDKSVGILLLLTHILASLSVGFLFRFWKSKKNSEKRNAENSPIPTVSFSSLGEVLSKSISSAIQSVIMIGGFIVLFSILLSILQNTHILSVGRLFLLPIFKKLSIPVSFIIPVLTGLLELTNGIVSVATIPHKNLGVNVIISSFLLGFGGISVLLQVWSILSKSDISIRPYLLGKLLHGFLAAFYTYCILTSVSYFSFLKL